jgi:pyrimidine-nucleoside phosphorylase
MLPVELIKKKRAGCALTKKEIQNFITDYLNEKIADYQMSALLMAIYFQGMSEDETLALTQSMMNSGEIVEFQNSNQFYVDKHSTGGIGDKTSLLLAPIVSSLGIPVPMISGRGLGHTGGTLDKLESIPGFSTQLSLKEFQDQIHNIGVCLIGQTPTICPADKRIYALRDVTGTVESLPLICASIMSKKLAEGINGLVLDVKFGSGAFMKSEEQARALAKNLMLIGLGAKKKVRALITNMNQPLGAFAGNSLEVQECLDILKYPNNLPNCFYEETRDLSLTLSAHMVAMARNIEFSEAYEACWQSLSSGQALKQWETLCKAQGGNLSDLPKASHKVLLQSHQQGYVHSFDLEKIGWLNVDLGAGRKTLTDKIEPTAGIEFHCKIGDFVNIKDPLFTVYGKNLDHIKKIQSSLIETISIKEKPCLKETLIYETLLS